MTGKTRSQRVGGYVGRWTVVALDVWLGSRFGFTLGLLIAFALALLILAGYLVAKSEQRERRNA